MSKKYNTEEPPILKVAEPDVAYNVSSTCSAPAKVLPIQERVILTEEMKASLHKAEKDLADGNCLSEEKFKARFAKWTSILA